MTNDDFTKFRAAPMRKVPPPADYAPEPPEGRDGGAVVIGFGACALSGFVMGLLIGWLL